MSDGASQLVVVGSLNADLTVALDHLPSAGETVIALSPARFGFGGKGGNQAAAAAALGGRVAMVARVGDDEAGAKMRSDLAERGVDTRLVRTTRGLPTGSAQINVDRGGDNTIVVDPGANGALSPEDVRDPVVVSASVVVVQLEIPLDAVAAAVSAANGLVLLNPAPAQTLPDEVLGRIDLLVPNRTELGLLAGSAPPDNLDETAELVGALPHEFDVVVTLGPLGALVVERSGGPRAATHVRAPRVDAIDATGAGDTFCGALAVALGEGWDLIAAARLAVAAASLSVTGHGARSALASRQEAERLAATVEIEPLRLQPRGPRGSG
ncbi:MAG: rbsK [Acidimicrobiaceae bacterium]|nr:rbsK [Acidimicrobiaceae bacterium]